MAREGYHRARIFVAGILLPPRNTSPMAWKAARGDDWFPWSKVGVCMSDLLYILSGFSCRSTSMFSENPPDSWGRRPYVCKLTELDNMSALLAADRLPQMPVGGELDSGVAGSVSSAAGYRAWGVGGPGYTLWEGNPVFGTCGIKVWGGTGCVPLRLVIISSI
ncbi:hypothetical protein BS47DRAFT_732999 [Hydnum rufescens UP504]|uniref:Uncharacterized protein n=1 Tax=Hydnum rufescens UP504 TaxID=1448309 RepID=A0A9P6DHK7_9AGAM|nr:hypothetical protein BS47DRAFT_732999 [Hydnum rufescens UP504]